MNTQTRKDLTPQGLIRRMFAETENGKVSVGFENPYSYFAEEERIFHLNWTEEDADTVIQRYNLLTLSLARIARVHDQLEDEENRIRLLSKDDLKVWETYVRPYEPMQVDWDELYPIPPCEPDELMSLVAAIHERSQLGDIIEEEQKLWDQYCRWNEEQSQKRIPFNRRSAADMVMRAMRYEKLLSLNAPEIVVTEEGRCLAEEMVLYYFGKEEPIIWD